MASIDERIVSMVFENAKFEAGIAQTMASLQKLDESLKKIGSVNSLGDIEKAANKVTLEQPMSALDKLKARFSRAGDGASDGFNEITKAANKVDVTGASSQLDKVQASSSQVGRGAADGFNEISKAASKVDVSGATSALDSVAAKFSVIEGAAAVAFGNIASQAAMRGAAVAKSFSVGPLQQGFEEYSTNLNSIQTILANTEQSGAGLEDVNGALQELNTYSDQTIYNFSQMAKNIGTFTAAGVDLDRSTASIKGIANLAALSGSNSQQAATAMYQLSQAISSGRVGLQDWNSVVNAGMGGVRFQNALVRTAQNMGALDDGAVKVKDSMGNLTIEGKSFRESIQAKPGQQSWLNSDVLTETLQQFTGDMSEAELVAKGFTKAQAADIMQMADTAKHAATEVKTLSGVFDVVKESIGSGWAKTFQLIFGDFEEAKKLFTGVTSFITGWVGKIADARNNMLQQWKDLGGRDILLGGLKGAFDNLFDVLGAVGKAFRDIFPPTTGKDLARLTASFSHLMFVMKPSQATLEGIRRTARGFFAVLHIGVSIVKGVFGVIGDLLGVVGKGSGSFLGLTGSIGDFLVALDDALTKGGLLKTFFDGLSRILQVPFKLITGIAGAIAGLFGDGDDQGAGAFSEGVDKVNKAVKPGAKLMDDLKRAWEGFKDLLGDIRTAMDPWLTDVANKISGFADMVADAIKNANWGNVFTALQTTFIGGLFLTVKKALGGGISDIGGGFMKNVNGVLEGVKDHLSAMQAEVKSNIILKIAAAVGILAVSLLLLSTLDPDEMTRSMTAIAVGLGQLMGAMALMTKISGGLGKSTLAMPVIATSLVILAGALVILAGAMKLMATMNWEELAKGMVGIAGGLAAVSAGVRLIGPGMTQAALTMIPMAIGLNLLAFAVKQFAGLNFEELGKGLAGVLGSLVAVATFITVLPSASLVAAGAGLILIGVGLSVLAGAVETFGSMPLEKMYVGLIGIAGAISAIGLAVGLMPPTIAAQAAGLILVSIALQGISAAVKTFGSLNIFDLAKGLIGLGAALVELAVGMYLMIGTAPGAAALLLAAAALTLLAPAIGLLGSLSFGTIIKGLGAMAAIILTLSVVGLVAAPGLIALAAGMALLGVAALPAAAAMYLFSKGLSLMASEGQKGVAVFLTALTGFVALLPTIVINFIKGLVEIVKGVVSLAPELVSALGIVIGIVLATIIDAAPKLGEAIGVLLAEIVNIIETKSGPIMHAGITLMLNFLRGIDQNISQVVSRVGSIVSQFLQGMANQMPKMALAGANLLVNFLRGIANNLSRVIAQAGRVGLAFLSGITQQIPKFIQAGAKAIRAFLTSIANELPSMVRAGVRVVTRFIDGVASSLAAVARAATNLVVKFFEAFGNRKNVARMVDAGLKAALHIMQGISDGLRRDDNIAKIINASVDIGVAMVEGIAKGLASLPKALGDKLLGPVDDAIGSVAHKLGIASPSKVFTQFGVYIVEGMDIGLAGFVDTLDKGLSDPLARVVNSSKDQMKDFRSFLTRDFKQGVQGSTDDIRGAFRALNDKITESMSGLKDQLAQDNDKLKELMVPGGDQDAVNRTYLAIKANEKLLKKAKEAQFDLIVGLTDEKKKLVGLSKDFDTVTKMLETAQSALDDAKRTRDDAQKSLTSQFSELPDIDQEANDKVTTFKQAMQERIIAVTKYRATLEKLRDLGLDDATFNKLLSEGTDDQAFADQLLATGKTGIDQINDLNGKLLDQATQLATQASTSLYQAGVDAAQGLVDGLKTKQDDIRATMEFIATEMVRAIKLKLKIRSPSRVFAEIGRFSAEGMAQGFQASSGAVVQAAGAVGEDAAEAVRLSMRHISETMQNEIDPDLTITPVLDLTQVQKDAKTLSDLTNVTPITAAASFGMAKDISSQATQAAEDAAAASGGDTIVSLEQNNYSPTALSEAEIYRQTKNQLGQVKQALGLPA